MDRRARLLLLLGFLRAFATPGMLLVKRDPLLGSLLEFRDPELEEVYHSRVFPASQRSFDLTVDDEDIVVVADAAEGTIARMTGPRAVVDHKNRTAPRAISYNARDGIVAWLEGRQKSVLAVTVYDSMTSAPIVTQRAALDVDGCVNATYAASLRPLDGDRWFFFFTCADKLHAVDMAFPLPTVSDPHKPLQATCGLVQHHVPLSYVTAMAAGQDDTILIARSDGDRVCEVVRFHLDVYTDSLERILMGEEILYKCEPQKRSRLTGVAAEGPYVYVAQNSASIAHGETFIGRLDSTAYKGTPLTSSSLEVVLDRSNPLLAQSDLFSPLQIRVKSSGDVTTLYWINTYDGRLRRYPFVTEDAGFRPLQSVLAEPSTGNFCPLAAVLLAGGDAPLIIYSDYGTNAIRKYRPALSSSGRRRLEKSANSASDDSLDGSDSEVVAFTASGPSDLLYVEESGVLYWVEADREMVVAYDLEKGEILANLTFRLDPEATSSRFTTLAYLPKAGRIYVADSSPQHPRILSWRAPHSVEVGYLGGGASVAWYGGGSWAPEALVGDPHTNVLYASSSLDGGIKAIFLTPRFHGVQKRSGPHGGYSATSRLAWRYLPTMSPAEMNAVRAAVEKAANEVEPEDVQIVEKFLDIRRQGLLIRKPFGFVHRNDYKAVEDLKTGPAVKAPEKVFESTAPQEALEESPQQSGGSQEASGQPLPSPPPPPSPQNVSAPARRSLEEGEELEPVLRNFYRNDGGAPVKHMWLNDGYLHWFQLDEHEGGNGQQTRITVLYKETLSTNNPTVPIDDQRVFEFVSAETEVFVSFAAFYEVRESFVPRNAGEWALVLSAAGGLITVAAGLRFVVGALRANKRRNYTPAAQQVPYDSLSPEQLRR